MKSTPFTLIACSLFLFMTATNSFAENDINAQDLSRDIKNQSQQPASTPSLPTPVSPETIENGSEDESTPPWFKVELIVFKQELDSVNEVFPSNIEYTAPETLIQLNNYPYDINHLAHTIKQGISYSDTPDNRDTVSPPKHTKESQSETSALSELHDQTSYSQEELLMLVDAQKRLTKSSTYDILLSTSWVQQTLPKEETPTLHITAGNWFDDQPELELFITVSKQRYLHAYVDAFLKTYNLKTDQPLALNLTDHSLSSSISDNESEQGIQPHHLKLFALNIDEQILGTEQTKDSAYLTDEVFYIHEDRIMKHSKDLYFLDHPKFGIIIKLTPLDKAREMEAELSEKSST